MRIRKNGIVAMEITIARIHLQCENAEGFKETAAYNNSMSFTARLDLAIVLVLC